ncbi:MAG: nucleotidyltransferase domain-containing protein [Spirochaetaceae bacterium]|nr:MAG: nucleotidyltransferase domain-containing protein [Spirochaetaceae bacterium]
MHMATVNTNLEQNLTGRLQSAFSGNLDSITLYGSYVRGTYRQGVSDINVLILLKEPDAAQIEKLGSESRRFLRSERVTPLILTKREFLSSADVFPMEYADIRETHRTIHGDDPTTELDLQDRNLRHQLEHQLRGNLVSLRQMILATRGNKRALKRQLTDWFGPMAAVFRGLVRLAGASAGETEPAPTDVTGLIERVNRLYNLEPGPFLALQRLPEDSSVDPLELSRELDRRLSQLAQQVDALRATLDRGSAG